MRLSEVAVRQSPVEWYEAVAVVRDLIDRLEGSDPARAPELHHVELLSIGSIELLGSSPTENQTLQVSRILRVLLKSGIAPGALLALPDQPFASLRQLSEALAPFERPDRPTVLQHLHRRMGDSVPVPEADALIASIRAAVSVPPAKPSNDQPVEEKRGPWLYYGGVAVASLLVFAVVVGFIWRGGSAGVAIAGVMSFLSPGAATGSAEPPAAPLEASDDKTAPTAGSGSVPQPSGTSVSITPRRTVRPEPIVLPALPSLPRRQTFATSALNFTLNSPAAVPAGGVVERVVPASEPDVSIHSQETPGIEAPVGIRPHVPKEVPPGHDRRRIARIELVIDIRGNVETARLLPGPRAMHDAMLVSAAKGWRFHPARMNGVPVRYRTTVLVPW